MSAPEISMDIVTVVHNDDNKALAEALFRDISRLERGFSFYVHDNSTENLGFAKGCNRGALEQGTNAPYIGFLNPDVKVQGGFIGPVQQILELPGVVITGNRYGKPDRELEEWGVRNWVCGASFFVRRDWFTEKGGFDEGFVWAWEETDLIRQAEAEGRGVVSMELPIAHSSPLVESPEDTQYKITHFSAGREYFYRKWGSSYAI